MGNRYFLGIGKNYYIIAATNFDDAKAKVVAGVRSGKYPTTTSSFQLYEVVNKKELVVADLLKIIDRQHQSEQQLAAEEEEKREFERLRRKYSNNT